MSLSELSFLILDLFLYLLVFLDILFICCQDYNIFILFCTQNFLSFKPTIVNFKIDWVSWLGLSLFLVWHLVQPYPPPKIHMFEIFPKWLNTWKWFCDLYLHDRLRSNGLWSLFPSWMAFQTLLYHFLLLYDALARPILLLVVWLLFL